MVIVRIKKSFAALSLVCHFNRKNTKAIMGW